MQARRYPSWRLHYLRLLRRPCVFGHPDMHDMEVVAASLSQKLVLDDKFVCKCLPMSITIDKCIPSTCSASSVPFYV
ncbi:hypothetical protein GALMADRAFT_736193 [Galerina marginata CBS 339.88]|uniref:Uncharacterized protein n=1 Tax=Galerina marginata (strain CBS 339.88) TaxID=685588 RepID=A0A067SPH2_GALM3|nr:hypothetical protein GALMADRAFT_736193 [Galerina marginata CBS 339.88]